MPERYSRLGSCADAQRPTHSTQPTRRRRHHQLGRLPPQPVRLRGFGARPNLAYQLRTCWAYGSYDLADGRQLLFNRDYQVISSPATKFSHWQPSQYQWESDVKDTKVTATTWFYDDGCPPWRNTSCFKRFQLVLRLRLEQPRRTVNKVLSPRTEAKRIGAKRFFGKICSKHPGLKGERYTSSGVCTKCLKVAARKRLEADIRRQRLEGPPAE